MYDVWKVVQVLNEVKLPALFQHNVESARRYLISVGDSRKKEDRMRSLKFASQNLGQVIKLKTLKQRFPGEIEKVVRAKDMVDEYISQENKAPQKAKRKKTMLDRAMCMVRE
jgi:hypothetical protein